MKDLVVVRGGGDIATGTIYKLYKCGFKVLVLEIEKPSAIRRHVSFCEAVYDEKQTIEGVTCVLAKNLEEARTLLEKNELVMLVDPTGVCIEQLKPLAVVDAILAKKNLGTTKDMAKITVGLGPGFEAGKDVDVVVETMRGHNLGKLIYEGSALANTGIPAVVGGYGKERVIHSPTDGFLRNVRQIGDTVKKGEVIAIIDEFAGNGDKRAKVRETMVTATLDGLLRGLIRDGYEVKTGLKIADIDPRFSEYGNCFKISDKARCIAGGVLEAILAGKDCSREV